MNKIKGKVWLVGAGPGDVGLFTLRGKEVLENADVVVFDRLVGEGIFSFINPAAELIDVGKMGGSHPTPQRDIEKILVDKALAGLKVVRLKGGDPFLFGRGGEEAEALRERGIPYEIVCGVTSALAAPAYAGIPVTHRDAASSLHIITAHTKDGQLPDMDYRALVSSGGTLVFMMGVSSLEKISSTLIVAGMDKNMPAAVIERATTAMQRTVQTDIESLPADAAKENIKSPAVIVVGKVAALAGSLAWVQGRPLFGKRILVTRPKDKAGRLCALLRDKGAEAIEYPCIRTETLPVNLPDLSGLAYLAFTSVTGVESFFETLQKNNRDIREIGTCKIAAIGSATAQALTARGLKVDIVPQVYDGVNLAKILASEIKENKKNNGKILLIRALEGAPEIEEILTQEGVNFVQTKVYRTFYNAPPFIPQNIDAAVFTSASTVRGFRAVCDVEGVKKAVCIGEQTARAARDAGFGDIYIAKKATIEELINTLEECFV